MPDFKTRGIRVRYMVDDVDAAIDFYTKHLGFTVLISAAPAFAALQCGELQLLLSGSGSSAGKAMPDGTVPVAGGWNRFQLIVSNIEEEAQKLKAAGVRFRNNIVHGPGGSQILLFDPSNNLVELFQPSG